MGVLVVSPLRGRLPGSVSLPDRRWTSCAVLLEQRSAPRQTFFWHEPSSLRFADPLVPFPLCGRPDIHPSHRCRNSSSGIPLDGNCCEFCGNRTGQSVCLYTDVRSDTPTCSSWIRQDDHLNVPKQAFRLPGLHGNHTAFDGDNRTGLPGSFHPVGSSSWPCFDV